MSTVFLYITCIRLYVTYTESNKSTVRKNISKTLQVKIWSSLALLL